MMSGGSLVVLVAQGSGSRLLCVLSNSSLFSALDMSSSVGDNVLVAAKDDAQRCVASVLLSSIFHYA